MSKIEVNAIEPQSGTTLTLGASGDTITIPSGATINNQGSAVNFGPTGAVSWNTTKVTTGFTATAGIGYFCDTTSAAFTVTLPSSPSAGAVIGICDYANTFATNNITVGRNGSNIGGVAVNAKLSTNGVSVTFVYVDATQGWIVTDSGQRSNLSTAQFVAATGGTITTCGDYKIHAFTGPGTFTVSCAGNSQGSNSVDYLVVAGGGGGGYNRGAGGGGAGGFRSSTSLPISATAYPITVGAGGAGSPTSPPFASVPGNPSIFSSITSAGGGGGGSGVGTCYPVDVRSGAPGGSGGGMGLSGFGSSPTQTFGTGNTPPVSPSQGNNGGTATGSTCNEAGGGGGGASSVGSNGTSPKLGGPGGSGSPVTSIFGASPKAFYGPTNGLYAGGGGGGGSQLSPGTGGTGGPGGGGSGTAGPGTAPSGVTNTGGGGGGGGDGIGGTGGSGIVLIRYKFQ
jgi:hypothetical protein